MQVRQAPHSQRLSVTLEVSRRLPSLASFLHPISSGQASHITTQRDGLVTSHRRKFTAIVEFVLMFNWAICSPIPLMFAKLPDARLALSMTLSEIVSAAVLVIVASPDSDLFFHAVRVDDPS